MLYLELTDDEREMVKLSLEMTLGQVRCGGGLSKTDQAHLKAAYTKIAPAPCPDCQGRGKVRQHAWTDNEIPCYCTREDQE